MRLTLRTILGFLMFVLPFAVHAETVKLGRDASIRITSTLKMYLTVKVPRGKRSEIARNFLANPADATRYRRGNKLVIPFSRLSGPYKAIAALRLFPKDRYTSKGIVHVVTRSQENKVRIARTYTSTIRNAKYIRTNGTVGEVSVTRDSRMLVTIKRSGVDLKALARAILKNPSRINRMTRIRKGYIVIDVRYMKDTYRGAALNHLFPDDTIREDARRHKVVNRVETLGRIARWFTGREGNWRRLKKASHKRSSSVVRREIIVIPRRYLASWAAITEDDIADETRAFPLSLTSRSRRSGFQDGQSLLIPRRYCASWTRLMVDGEDGAQEAANWYIYRGQKNGPLTFKADRKGAYAEYRLRRGEALYSNVVTRFSGLDSASSVLKQAKLILKRSGYRSARSLPVGARIKIPMTYLSPDWRPKGDPTREAEKEEAKEVARVTREIRKEDVAYRKAAPATARGTGRLLRGVTVIIDAGHGGRDPGAMSRGGLTENEVCYDIFTRVRKLLLKRTKATVHATNYDRSTKYNPSSRGVIRDNRNECLRTTPNFCNTNTVTSANLRFYLANAYVASAVRKGRKLDNVIFISLHADALHTSISGATIYIPSARYATGRYRARSKYRRYREVRQRPTVSLSKYERLRAQARSQRMASELIRQFRRQGIAIHGRKPIRGYIVRSRGRRPFVPAVIRYNKAPTKMLIEIGNIKNRRDAASMRSPRWREKFAKATVDAIIRVMK
jgi:N-acetylmuramoyl-L-alanine amidase